ncbi:hypothetical protein C0V72_14290 [Porphyrobacter sp. TH134]|uniref:glycosyltransferase family 4 protein n=1 Tax=Porphyrobacter sp. TH134 TaxID=2067450 RepID=UPI000C7DC936|nr:glycosyltransferase family 4 protein [Porphyrobacter sp. TH134]PLK22554.1 hypothetical protein C0V72_14290 [Porphyrobacter sp. TH134]
MKAMLDLSGIKSGGGAQLATNFLAHIAGQGGTKMFEFILVSDKFPRTETVSDFSELVVAPSSIVGRLRFEHVELPCIARQHGVTHSYTFFGPGLPARTGLKQLVGVAYPTLVYDDSPYWDYLPPGFKVKKRAQNALRKARLRQADHLIFETDTMLERAKRAGLVTAGSSVIPPTPTAFLKASPPPHTGPVRFLILAGTDPHKNLWRLFEALPMIADEALDVRFAVSITRNAFLAAMVHPDPAKARLVDTYFEFLGALPPDRLQEAYDDATVVLNIADLESFSNNYMEAWLTGRPLLVSDRDFARDTCGGSAIYVEPHDIASLVSGLRQFAKGQAEIAAMVAEGRQRLKRLPTIEQRTSQILALLSGL